MAMRKSDQVRAAVARKDWKIALRIAKDFRIGISSTDREEMSRAYECIVHPEFYIEIGIDLKETIEKGVRTVNRLYGSVAA